MSLVVHPIKSPETETIIGFTIQVSFASIKEFREMVARACNTWDSASADMKYFHDDIIHGKGLQNYNSMAD